MKLRLTICAMAAGTALFAGEEVTSTATYAVMNVTNAYTDTVVAVPWVGLDGSEITISNLVNTTTLSENDKLYMYGNDGKWYAYTKNAVGNWIGDTTVSSEGVTITDAASQQVARGTGLILQRASAGGTVLLCGRVGSGSVSTTIAANGTTLFANPTTTAVNLNDKFTSAHEGDTITIPLNNGGSNVYTFKGTAWGQNTKVARTRVFNGVERTTYQDQWVSGGSIPAGTGALYDCKGTGYTVEW